MITFTRFTTLFLSSFLAFSSLAQAECSTTMELALRRLQPCLSKNSADCFRDGNSVPLTKVARYYLSSTGTHFWTTNPAEMGTNWCQSNAAYTVEGYSYQSGIFNVASSTFTGSAPVHRFRNTQNSGYFYTISESERLIVMANMPQYLYEGVAWYAATAQIGNTKPVYRFYNTVQGGHFYTSNETERQVVLTNFPSYVPEGIAFWAW